MNIMVFKICSFLAVLITGIVGGRLSLKIAASPRSDRIFSLGNAFAGGIFLGAGFLHMLPDAIEGFRSWSGQSDFPWPQLFCAAGFLLVLMTAKVFFDEHQALAEAGSTDQAGGFTPYILTLVLSVHSIIAGIALGTEQTLALSAIILVAVIAHKGSAAFALGVNLLRSGMSERVVLGITVFFSFMTPLGIVLGVSLTAALTGKSETIVESLFDAVAAGTFIYLAANHIIEEEFGKQGNKWPVFGMVVLGLALMAGLAAFL